MALLDAYGRPIDVTSLRQRQAEPTVGGIRHPYAGFHPAANLTPQRLTRLLVDSIDGDMEPYLELAQDMEERDLHYAAVLGVRKRQVAGLEITVEAASDAAEDVAAADLVRTAVDQPGFADDLIDVLDAIGKGVSFCEIIWETSERQWMPRQLAWADPRWFEFDRATRRVPALKSPDGPLPLKPAGWVTHVARAKSGLPIRGGLARAAAWSFLFKSFTAKDWAIFLEAYGHPLRVGKYQNAATDDQKAILLRAVRSIGTDFGAIIPDDMKIEFVSAALSGTIDGYERRADWLDRQVSKLVLGQTQTTDATAGGYATAKVHDGVRDDIEESDARQLAATLMRDLVRPIVDLNMGPRRVYPTLRIGRPDVVDVAALVDQVAKLVPLGLKVGMSTLRDRIGLPDPAPDEELLGAAAAQPATVPGIPGPLPAGAPTPATPGASPAGLAAQSALPPAADAIDRAVADMLADDGWEPLIAPIVEGLQERLDTAETIEDVRTALAAQVAAMDVDRLAEALGRMGFSAHLAGAAGESLLPRRTP